MEQRKCDSRYLTAKQKRTIAVTTGLFAVIGAVLGVIAYYQHWLG